MGILSRSERLKIKEVHHHQRTFFPLTTLSTLWIYHKHVKTTCRNSLRYAQPFLSFPSLSTDLCSFPLSPLLSKQLDAVRFSQYSVQSS